MSDNATPHNAASHPQAGRIIAVSALLRGGHTPQQVSAALKAIDDGRSLEDVWKALKS